MVNDAGTDAKINQLVATPERLELRINTLYDVVSKDWDEHYETWTTILVEQDTEQPNRIILESIPPGDIADQFEVGVVFNGVTTLMRLVN